MPAGTRTSPRRWPRLHQRCPPDAPTRARRRAAVRKAANRPRRAFREKMDRSCRIRRRAESTSRAASASGGRRRRGRAAPSCAVHAIERTGEGWVDRRRGRPAFRVSAGMQGVQAIHGRRGQAQRGRGRHRARVERQPLGQALAPIVESPQDDEREVQRRAPDRDARDDPRSRAQPRSSPRGRAPPVRETTTRHADPDHVEQRKPTWCWR